MIDPLLARLVAVLLGLLLAAAALHKLASFERFAAVLQDYRLLPTWLCRPAALLVVAVEVILAIGWLSGLETGLTAVLSAALFAVYGVAIAINLMRGRVHISCGCALGAAADGDQHLSWRLVFRNALLAGAALLTLLPLAPRLLHSLDWATLAAAVLTAALLWAGVAQLLRNRAAIRSWRHSGG